jgi:hypothetical protein
MGLPIFRAVVVSKKAYCRDSTSGYGLNSWSLTVCEIANPIMFRYISADSKQPALARDPLDLVCLTCQAIVNTIVNLVYLLCDRFDRLNLYGMVVSSCVHRRCCCPSRHNSIMVTVASPDSAMCQCWLLAVGLRLKECGWLAFLVWLVASTDDWSTPSESPGHFHISASNVLYILTRLTSMSKMHTFSRYEHRVRRRICRGIGCWSKGCSGIGGKAALVYIKRRSPCSN